MSTIKARDIVIELEFSGVSQVESDAVPSYEEIADYSCYCRSYSREESYETYELKAIADVYTKKYVTTKTAKVEIEVVANTVYATTFQNKSGYFVRVTATLPMGATDQVIVDEGVVVSTSMSVDLDGILTEKLSIELGAYGVVTPTSIT
jgi:hypothetical protein